MGIASGSYRNAYSIGRLALLGATILFALFFSVSFSFAAPPIRIAMVTAKTGVAGKTNSSSFVGAQFAVEEINRTGGILGREVELLEYDNLSTPEGSAIAGLQAVKDGAVAVVGCNWSSHSLALAKVLQKARIPMVTHMSTNNAVTRVGDYIFRACYTDSHQGKGLARFAYSTRKAETAVVLVNKARTYSIGLADTFIETFEYLGGEVVWRGEYDLENVSYQGMLKEVAKHDPDVLFVPGGYDDVSAFFGGARDLNAKWDLLSADGIGVRMYDYIGEKANGVLYASHWSKWADSDVSRDFVRRFEEKIGPVREDTMALVYDSFMVIKEAIERAGSTEGAKVRDALAATPGHVGVTGTIRFDANGDPIKPMFINKFKFGGIMYLDMVYP